MKLPKINDRTQIILILIGFLMFCVGIMLLIWLPESENKVIYALSVKSLGAILTGQGFSRNGTKNHQNDLVGRLDRIENRVKKLEQKGEKNG